MLAIQKFLKSRSVADLREDPFNLHIQTKTFDEGELVLLKYNQFKSTFSHALVRESRGIILEKGTLKIICHPFHKFFNLGEEMAFNHIVLLESVIMEKVDGSLIKVYFYNKEWQVATNGTIDAGDAKPGFITVEGQQLPSGQTNYRELFFNIIPEDDFREMAKSFDTEKTYLFEMIHPLNQIVVNYSADTKELVFIGMKDNEGTNDYNIFDKSIEKKYNKIFKKYPVRFPKSYGFGRDDVVELQDIADELNEQGNEFEGFVVSQVKDNLIIGRVKIKSSKYVQLHHIATGESISKNLIDVLLKNEMEEFEVYLGKLPHAVSDEYDALKKKYFELVQYLCEQRKCYAEKSLKVSRKELALSIQRDVSRNKQGMIFTLIDRELSVEELLKSYGAKKVRDLL